MTTESSPTRPASVTIVSGFLIFQAAMALILIPLTVRSPDFASQVAAMGLSRSMLITGMFTATLVTFVSGVAMLARRKLGRTLFTGFSVVAVAVMLVAATNKMGPFPVFLVAGVMVMMIHRPAANRWFAGPRAPTTNT